MFFSTNIVQIPCFSFFLQKHIEKLKIGVIIGRLIHKYRQGINILENLINLLFNEKLRCLNCYFWEEL